MPSLTLLIIYYSQSPEDNGENLETWVGSSPICSSKASNNIKNKELSLVLPLKKKPSPTGTFLHRTPAKISGVGFFVILMCAGDGMGMKNEMSLN